MQPSCDRPVFTLTITRRNRLTLGVRRSLASMTNQHKMPEAFADLHAAIVADIKRHVTELRQSGVEFYGYAALPPDYGTAFDPTTMAVAFNRESDIDASNRGQPYYRYSVDEWQNYVHDGFESVNGELKSLLADSRESVDDSIDDGFVESIYQTVLDAMLALRADGTFNNVPYLIVWLTDSGDDILNRSAKLLNSSETYSDFATEFGG
jgi:hypothetical protein